jgi:putative drug exporter of the RND superfamily
MPSSQAIASHLSPPPQRTLLGRMAGALFFHRRSVVAGWVLVLIAAIAGLSQAGKYVADYATPGSDSKAAATILADQYGGRTDQSVDIVYHDKTSVTGADVTRRLDSLLGQAGHLPGLQARVTTAAAEVSSDGRTAIVSIPLTRLKDNIPTSTGATLLKDARRLSTGGLTVAVGGEDVGQGTAASSSELVVGITVAMVILVMMFGGLIAAGLPLLTSMFGLGISVALVGLLARLLPTPSWALQMATMLGLGVGIDYALLVLTRHKAEMAGGLSPEEATVEAMSTAGRSVLIAGATVVISLLGLFLMGLPYLYGVALASSLTVLVMLAATVTLLPAMLGFAGHGINRLSVPGMNRAPVNPDHSRAAQWARWIQRRPLITGTASVLALLALSAPVLGIRFGFPDAGNDPVASTTRVAYDLVAKGFGAGANGPLIAVVSTPTAQKRALVPALQAQLRAQPDVSAVSAPHANPQGTSELLVITPKSSPQAKATKDLVSNLRRGPMKASGLDVRLGGQTASVVDQGIVTANRLPLFIGGVLIMAFLLLIAAFRAPIIAAKAGLMNLLSIGAAYGVVALVAQGGWAGRLVGIDTNLPIPPFIPVIMFAALFGLSMDYEVFLMSSIREAMHRGGNARDAVVTGMARTSKVITAAAAIMVFVFGAFALTPDVILKLIGIGLATAILVDATIVRMILVPSLMQLLGERSWWTPRWITRLLPEESDRAAHQPPTRNAPHDDDARRAGLADELQQM